MKNHICLSFPSDKAALTNRLALRLTPDRSPARLEYRLFPADGFHGAVSGDKFWVAQTVFGRNFMPLRYFEGTVADTDSGCVLQGRFRFLPQYSIASVILWVLMLVAALFFRAFGAPVGVCLLIVLFFTVFDALHYAAARLFRRKEEQAILEFLTALKSYDYI